MLKGIFIFCLSLLVSFSASAESINLRYLYASNGGLIGFYDDDQVRGCAQCDFIASNVVTMQESKPYAKWHNTDMEIVWGDGEIIPLYKEGAIADEWKIFESQPVISTSMVTKYEPFTQSTLPPDALELKETTAVMIIPPLKTFTDENSTEAQDYSTTMEDWAFYASQARSFFESLHVPVIESDRHRFVIALADNRKVIFDANHSQPQNESDWQLVLYRKGQLPIMLDLTETESDVVNKYLAQP